MGRQVGCTGQVRIGELLGEDREEEERDDNWKDIFRGIKEDEVVDHLLGVYCRFCSFLYALSRSTWVISNGPWCLGASFLEG